MKPFGIQEIRTGDVSEYAAAYLRQIDDINTEVKNSEGIKTALSSADLVAAEDLVRASAVLSDLTTLTLGGGKELSLVLPIQGTRKVQLPLAYLQKYKINPNDPKMHVGVAQFVDDNHTEFIRNCLPLLERGSLLLRPPRFIMFQTSEHNWQGLPVEPDAQDDNWIVSGETKSLGEMPVRVETDSAIPIDIALPYLRGVPMNEFVKILDDAGDTILNLRRSLREALTKNCATDSKAVAQFRRDVIDPEIDTLNRTFKKAVASHTYTIGGAVVGVISLSLSAIVTAGATAVASGLLGAGGVGLVAKEYGAYRAKLEEMKDHPYYLFWRAKHHR